MADNEFSTGAILSITTGMFIADEGEDFGIVYEILNFMTEDDLFTTQLGRAAEQCKPYLCEQFPWANVTVEAVQKTGWRKFLAECNNLYGKTHVVLPIHREDQTHNDPMVELAQMLDGGNVKILDGSNIKLIKIDPSDVDIDELVDNLKVDDEGEGSDEGDETTPSV